MSLNNYCPYSNLAGFLRFLSYECHLYEKFNTSILYCFTEHTVKTHRAHMEKDKTKLSHEKPVAYEPYLPVVMPEKSNHVKKPIWYHNTSVIEPPFNDLLQGNKQSNYSK